MRREVLAAGVALAALVCAPRVEAAIIPFTFNGAGISGSGTFTVGPDPVAGDPANALAITGVGGRFSDANIGILNATITGIVPTNPLSPPNPPPFPGSFGYFPAANLPPPGMAVSYDNLIYLDGSPLVCPDYDGFGGFLDTFGVLFTIDAGGTQYTVDLWSDGTAPDLPPLSYGALVVDSSGVAIDYQFAGIAASVPEPATMAVLGFGLLGLALGRRRRA